MKENSDRTWEKIVGVVDEYTDSKDVEIKFSNNSIFIILHFKTNEECKYVKIRQQFNTLLLIGPWDDPEIEVVYYHTIKDGTEGDFYKKQDYNEANKTWNPSYERFVEELPPALD